MLCRTAAIDGPSLRKTAIGRPATRIASADPPMMRKS